MQTSSTPQNPDADVHRGIEAYERGDYTMALDIFKPRAYAIEDQPDPWATFYLARMTESGRGTEMDAMLACAMSQIATREFDRRAVLEWKKVSEQAEREACQAFAGANVNEAGHLWNFACRDGVPRTDIPLGNGDWVSIRIDGIDLQMGGSRYHSDPLRGTCGQVTWPIYYTPIKVQRGSTVVTRRFLEFFLWQSGINRTDGQPRLGHQLMWMLAEIAGTEVKIIEVEQLVERSGTPYPSRDLDSALRDLIELRPTADGYLELINKGQDTRRVIE
jgi:hypothetical protein